MIFLNEGIVEIKRFPNGEVLMNSESFILKDTTNEIKLKFENDEDITHLIFLKGHLDELRLKCNLVLPYMPYSRMDRTEGITVFTLKQLCRIINNLNFESVTIYEPHSEVSVALLNRVKVIDMSRNLAKELLVKVNGGKEEVYLVYPDAGAAKRYSKQINYEKILTANKERDFKTGFIKNLEINGNVQGKSFKAIIIDDLCSKGGTFILTASKLKEMGATEIYLVITHCENTIFEGDILKTDLIKKVYTTNSILNREHEKIKVYNI
ncbi:ribose-phosphate pyrophosphokinase [Clostridium cavendishii DSM 21758]|uniref:ribose-phosphate diphosphokinase n=1 Tax=Clostridium cavendishii DSM 21758 TaxID=1121302 RepID=A0A1M6RXL8_9CLOT|nr:ribose-phosphate pyrophosphokinase [Clostridium cavendishii]SHK37078.1 ribose-phosphate pyrophosphokinase [Clostridium cavendishii DSM 21758]